MGQLFTWACTNQTTSWLVCNWNIFRARTNHKHTWIHKTHHGPDLGEATTFPFIIFSMISHRGCMQMSFYPRTHKLTQNFPKLRLPQLWRPITSCVNLWLKWYLKISCSPCQELSKDMWHATWMQVNQGDPQLLVIENQIDTLTYDLSFGHNFCFKYSNGSCEPILDIYISKSLQCYKESN